MEALHTKCPTLMSTEGGKNRNISQNSFNTYPETIPNQLQIPPSIIPSSQVFLLAGFIPALYNNQLKPIFTNAIPIENIQIPIIPILNVAKEIDCLSEAIENKFDLTPEIPEQIFTLPFLQLESSETHSIQDQNSISSNMEQPTKPNIVEELAKISDQSKKIPLSVEIPELLPPKSLFPLYSTPPGGMILKQLEVPTDQVPTTSDFYFGSLFASPQEIHPMSLSDQNTLSDVSRDSQLVIGQSTPQSATYHSYYGMEEPTISNEVEELAKISDEWKKISSSVEIPELLPTKSLFPLYSTPPGAIISKTLEVPTKQEPATSDIYVSSLLASPQEIHPMSSSDQNTSCGVSCDSHIINLHQSVTYNYSIQTRFEENNQIQPVTQEHNLESSIMQQPFNHQNRCVGPQYLATNPITLY